MIDADLLTDDEIADLQSTLSAAQAYRAFIEDGGPSMPMREFCRVALQRRLAWKVAGMLRFREPAVTELAQQIAYERRVDAQGDD